MADKSSDSQVDGNPVATFRFKDQKDVKFTIRASELVAGIITAIGDDPEREGLLDTPARVVKSWKELFRGYKMDPVKILGTQFDAEGYDNMVVCKDIELYSTCEHHMIPFFGKVHIGYLPSKKVVGLSKLARLADVFARRLQIQERLTNEIADTLHKTLDARGTMVVVEAKHMCMCSRGVGKQHSSMVTSSVRGIFKEDAAARAEFMALIK